jgi:hypothetical protein
MLNEGKVMSVYLIRILWTAILMMAASAAYAAQKLPLREGEYTSGLCNGSPDYLTTIGVHTLTLGPQVGMQSLSPAAEGQDGSCVIRRLKVSGNAYSGSTPCDSGTRMSLPTGTYRFSYTIIDNATFISKGKTYRWCAEHR